MRCRGPATEAETPYSRISEERDVMMGAKTPINLQDGYLNQVRKDSTVVNVFLINGCKLRGVVRGFDSFTIVLESEGKQHLLYKHAVSTVTPTESVKPLDCCRGPQPSIDSVE